MTRMVFVIVKHESLKHVGIRGGACERECEFEKESVGEGLTLMDGKVKGLELKAGRRFGWRRCHLNEVSTLILIVSVFGSISLMICHWVWTCHVVACS